jgi:hypothetical protein
MFGESDFTAEAQGRRVLDCGTIRTGVINSPSRKGVNRASHANFFKRRTRTDHSHLTNNF